ncbi:gamma-glutamyltransferase [Novacetimonas maltaceti]|uniref:Putative gamma-glutamyltransferase YwrD n=1 Tax=Novacetimonas maltaceti TaxID=1203393 RepID=A0A2S3W694_9PROT|nr:gamma-glutamyltransferase [Novacetimonas maltaceti]POF64073.1 putative gamma-glutamyltransferase YwrD [Novacetimonas maltaceti]PYD62131.1 gamma-glutamyltransferase [Novacetimonas maltaceti]
MLNTPRSCRGMVTSPHHLASQAGLDILKAGGTAIEAAVATAAALAVVYPHMTGIGGDAFWLTLWPDGRAESIDASGAAAMKADVAFYRNAGLDRIPWRGPLAANTVAGTVSGWDMALSWSHAIQPGLPLGRILADAIYYAEQGVPVTAGAADITRAKVDELRAVPGFADQFMPAGRLPHAGDILHNPRLARTLRVLADEGLDSFYRGRIAADLAADLAALGSPLALSDLQSHRAVHQPALHARIRGADLYNVAPPTQGVASLLILSLFDRLRAAKVDSYDYMHTLVEATKLAFRYRDTHVGDPALMTVQAQDILDDAGALDRMAASIDPQRAAPWPHPSQAGDTVWLGVIDSDGLAVSMIQSLYFECGSGVVLPRTGVVWQNRGTSFGMDPDGWNGLRPGRKPFHTLNPAGARLDDGRTMVYGTMGGEGQPQTQAAVFTRYACYGVPLQRAVTAPRWLLGRTWGEESVSLKYEDRFDPELIARMQAAGHQMERMGPFTSTMGHAGALVRHEKTGLIEGATDPRSDGGVAAW